MHSFRARLLLLWLLSLAAAIGVGVVLVQLYRQSSAAQVQRAEAVIARGCDAIRDRYDFYTAGWSGPGPAADAAPFDTAESRRALTAAVALALGHAAGVEGGIWQAGSGSLAYAYPTYPGDRPKTDLPAAELERIASVNEAAARDDQPVSRSVASATQTLLLQACPLGGPVAGVTGWTMTRVGVGSGYDRLRLGIAVLLALVLGMSAILAHLALVWSRHVGRIEAALARHDIEALPSLPPTGERELDRIVAALNDAGARLAAARGRAAELSARVAASERLAALGRVAAGLAHEIRNPIAAMRLRAENALAGDDRRRRAALDAILAQIARLDRLIAELLAMTQGRAPRPEVVDLPDFLETEAAACRDLAASRGVALEVKAAPGQARLDPALIGRALDNLLRNAVHHAPPGGTVWLRATAADGALCLLVEDTGPGVAPELRASLFEPFVTGRADGTGLGLAIAREMVQAQGGRLRLLRGGGEAPGHGAAFLIELPQAAVDLPGEKGQGLCPWTPPKGSHPLETPS